MRFSRITVQPEKMGGVPCIRGLRIPVATVVGMVANGMSIEIILKEYPDLEKDDIFEALAYAAEAEEDLELHLKALRRARAEMAVNKIQQRAKEKGLDALSQSVIEGEIKSARRMHY